LDIQRATSGENLRKRVIDVKAAQDYIKEQKKRRRTVSQNEKAKLKIKEEEKMKRLEELRLKSLQLASSSRRKSPKKVRIEIFHQLHMSYLRYNRRFGYKANPKKNEKVL